MRKSSQGKTKKGEPYTDIPPGGRALQRIQQDRLARGLGEIPQPAKPAIDGAQPADKQRQTTKHKTKRAKPS